MILRAAAVAAVILGGGAYASVAQSPDREVARASLASLPCALDRWTCAGDTPLDGKTLALLGVDDYINRTYRALPPDPLRQGFGGQEGGSHGIGVVGLYIGYYASQRQGEAIHSPQNCLPGSGWQPVSAARATLDTGRGAIAVNRYVVQKGLDRQVVLYWYQGRGRVVANEYVNKFWLMLDQGTLHRSNGALVRVVVPVNGTDAGALASASASADEFTRAIYPRLSPYLP
ncbi:MAG TPA: EpsI family protein [Vicinamibacterales bacterium]|nr:EpsI family protein [Vicinamibacterales bacterium]